MKNRVKELRKHLGMSQCEFAEAIGVSRNYVSLVENGERNLSENTVWRIAKEFDVSEDWLMNGTGEMTNPKSEKDQIGAFVDEIRASGSDDPRRTVLTALSKLPPEDWKAIADLVELLQKNTAEA